MNVMRSVYQLIVLYLTGHLIWYLFREKKSGPRPRSSWSWRCFLLRLVLDQVTMREIKGTPLTAGIFLLLTAAAAFFAADRFLGMHREEPVYPERRAFRDRSR